LEFRRVLFRSLVDALHIAELEQLEDGPRILDDPLPPQLEDELLPRHTRLWQRGPGDDHDVCVLRDVIPGELDDLDDVVLADDPSDPRLDVELTSQMKLVGLQLFDGFLIGLSRVNQTGIILLLQISDGDTRPHTARYHRAADLMLTGDLVNLVPRLLEVPPVRRRNLSAQDRLRPITGDRDVLNLFRRSRRDGPVDGAGRDQPLRLRRPVPILGSLAPRLVVVPLRSDRIRNDAVAPESGGYRNVGDCHKRYGYTRVRIWPLV